MPELASATMEKGTDEWRMQRIREIAADYWEFQKRNQKIRDKDGSIVPLVPNSVQRKLAEMVLSKLEAGVPVRLIVLKARQMGLSTEIESIVHWYTSTHKNISATVIAHLDDAARNIYEMFRRYYDNSLPMFQPALKYNTKADLTYKNLGSQILTASAESKEVGRSRTNQIVHGSEVAFWSNAKELIAGLLQTVPMRPNTIVIWESTANGIGGYFYETYQAAKRGDSAFEAIFFPWYEMEEYSLPAPKDYLPNGLTKEVMDAYPITLDQAYWYDSKLKEFGNDIDRMRQEYPSNDMEAFIASGRPRFDIKALLEMEKHAWEGERGYLTKGEIYYEFNKADKAPLQVWRRPERNGQYTLGGDVAEGLEHGDYSVLEIMDQRTLETVARWRGHCDPDVLGQIAYEIATWYNNALVGIEVNNHGLTTIQALKNLKYHNLYRREDGRDSIYSEASSSKLGWKTDSRTKPLMVDKLAIGIREKALMDFDMTFIRECMTYVVDENGRTNAQEGCFDDCVIAKAINLQMREWNFARPDLLEEDTDSYIPD